MSAEFEQEPSAKPPWLWGRQIRHFIGHDFAQLFPPIIVDTLPADMQQTLLRVREQILTALLDLCSLLGTLTLLISALPPLRDAPLPVYLVDALMLGLLWVLVVYRQLAYRLRAGLVLASVYVVSCTELLNYGFSQDAPLLFSFLSLLALILFNRKIGMLTFCLSAATIAVGGALIATGRLTPLAHPAATLDLSTATTTCLLFVLVVGTLQLGLAVLFQHLKLAWQREYQARMLLQGERKMLEQRVAARTRELAEARDHALAARRDEAAQKDYLAALYQTTLDLLHRREVDDVLQTIVERAAQILDAPYGELMLQEEDALVVYAFTTNQPFLRGDRVRRDEARISWQVYDTQQPVIVNDYMSWAGHRAIYDDVALHAVADFPIVIGGASVGVLAMGRSERERQFSSAEVERGMLFSQLAALVVQNARLYDSARHELDQRVQAELVLQQYANELQAQNVELDAFAHMAAHDLKTPLTAIIGYGQLLQLSQPSPNGEELAHIAGTIMRVGRKMASIVDELLLLARVRTLESVPNNLLNMGEIVAEVELRLRDRIAAAQAIVCTPARWPDALGYAPWVEEVWENYISNAIKYGGSPPTITLGADRTRSGQVRFWVRDDGEGLSAEQQARLFTPFTRLHVDRNDGHGLGLSIVQRIIAKLGGEVGVQSAPGQGCTFYFTLPAS